MFPLVGGAVSAVNRYCCGCKVIALAYSKRWGINTNRCAYGRVYGDSNTVAGSRGRRCTAYAAGKHTGNYIVIDCTGGGIRSGCSPADAHIPVAVAAIVTAGTTVPLTVIVTVLDVAVAVVVQVALLVSWQVTWSLLASAALV